MVVLVETEATAAAVQQSVSLLLRRLRQTPVQDELSAGERSALSKLDLSGSSTSAELSRVEQISPQSMGSILAGLESRGLIERNRDALDGRRIVLSITRAGRQLVRDKRNARTDQIATALSTGFTQSELRKLLAAAPLLERLAEQL